MCYTIEFGEFLKSLTIRFTYLINSQLYVLSAYVHTIAYMQPALLYVVQSYVYMCVGIQPQLQLVSQYANLQSTDMTPDQSLMKCEFCCM